MANRVDSMGIYGDMQRKREANYDVQLEHRVQAWIEGLIGRKLEGKNLQEGLMDMTAVCECVNRVKPGTIKNVRRSPVLMFRRENFGNFQTAIQKMGVRDSECCSFEDIYENRNMTQCLVMFVAFARNVQYSPGYNGPILQDAAKNSGQGASASHIKSSGLSPLERKALEAQQIRDQSVFVEHPVVKTGPAQTNAGKIATGPGASQRKPQGPVLTPAEQQALKAQQIKDKSSFTEHPIVKIQN